MSKTIASPVTKFPGTITISDHLTHPQAIAYWHSLRAAKALTDATTIMEINYALLPGLVACVEKWEIEGIPMPVSAETFPATPARACRQLVQWVHEQIRDIANEAEDIPNA